MSVTSKRLILRPWTDADRAPFNAMSADPEVMRYLTPRASRAASDAWIDRQIAHQAQHGFCFWAVQSRLTGAFMGSIGLLWVSYEAHFTPAVEAGWRLARPFWGQGYAPEAAEAALRYGFETLHMPEIVANTATGNHASQRVMAKLGMVRDAADDFDHPRLAEDDPLRRQVLFRLSRAAWQAGGRNRA